MPIHTEEEDHEFYAAVGSRQRVKVKKKFQKKAKKAFELCEKAIAASGQKNERQKWRDVFGKAFPAPAKLEQMAHAHVFKNTEEFVEDRFIVDIRYHLRVNCEVTQNGFRPTMLRELLEGFGVLRPEKKLRFFVADALDLPDDVEFHWKVLNRGHEAEIRDMIRGQIVRDDGRGERQETTTFRGDHLVECYAVSRGVVVARDAIRVPIRVRDAQDENYAA